MTKNQYDDTFFSANRFISYAEFFNRGSITSSSTRAQAVAQAVPANKTTFIRNMEVLTSNPLLPPNFNNYLMMLRIKLKVKIAVSDIVYSWGARPDDFFYLFLQNAASDGTYSSSATIYGDQKVTISDSSNDSSGQIDVSIAANTIVYLTCIFAELAGGQNGNFLLRVNSEGSSSARTLTSETNDSTIEVMQDWLPINSASKF